MIKKKPRSAKRFAYQCVGQITVGNELDEIRITNISASGIQFETQNQIKLKTHARLLWKDTELGILSSNMFVVREVLKPENSFKFIYGAQYHNLDSELKEKLIKLLKSLKIKEEQEILEKVEQVSPEYLLEITKSGSGFLKQFLNGEEVKLPALVKAAEHLADYEKKSFLQESPSALLIQRFSSHTFQCRVLAIMVPVVFNQLDLKSNFFQCVTDAIQTTKETEDAFNSYRTHDQATMDRIEESKNRMFYAKQDMLQIVYETFESIDGKSPEYVDPLKTIATEYEHCLEVTNSSSFDLSNGRPIKKNKLPKVIVDEMIIDNRPTTHFYSTMNIVLALVLIILGIALMKFLQ